MSGQSSVVAAVWPPSTMPLTDLPKPWLAQLVQQHLSPKDRLSLFRASTACATAVLQHTHTQQWLHRPSHLPPDTLQQLVAASAQHLVLEYEGGAFPGGVAGVIKQLWVDGFHTDASSMPWHQMEQLREVWLLGYSMQCSSSLRGLCAAVQGGHCLPGLHTVGLLGDAVEASAAALAACTLGPRLTSLVVASLQPFMPHFSHFTRLTSLELGGYGAGLLPDSAYAQLAAHPSLQQVQLAGHHGAVWPDTCRVCPTWPRLSILDPNVCKLDRSWMLQAGQVVLTGTIRVVAKVNALDEAGTYARVLTNLQQLGDRLRLESTRADRNLLFVCRPCPCAGSRLLMAHLAQRIHAAEIGVMDTDLSAPSAAALLSNLPPSVQQVGFMCCKCTQPVAEVLALLPTHVTRLVFRGWKEEWVNLFEGLLSLPQHISLCTVYVDRGRSHERGAAAVLQRLAIPQVVAVVQG